MDYSYVEVMKNRNRMCEQYDNCIKCPLVYDSTERRLACGDFCKCYPEEAQDIIMRWAEAHPVKTNLDVFCETFGVEKEDVDVYSCPFFDSEKCGSNCGGCKYEYWWQQEYKSKEE